MLHCQSSLTRSSGEVEGCGLQIINMSDENNKIIFCSYYSSFIPGVLSNEWSPLAFPIGSWHCAHAWDLPSACILPSVFLTFMSLSSIQLPNGLPFHMSPVNTWSASLTTSGSWNTPTFHYCYHCLSLGCWHLLMHFNGLHTGLSVQSWPPLTNNFPDIYSLLSSFVNVCFCERER